MNNSKNCWTVYCHTTPSGKRYIGITSTTVKKRWKNGKNYNRNAPFGKAIEKYGWENINHEILDTNLDEFEAKCLEEYYIFSYRTYIGFSDCNGYNCTLGGEGAVGFKSSKKGKTIPDEIKKKISESSKGKNLGKHPSDETRRKISASLIGNKNNYGKHPSDETRRKSSESHKGQIAWNKGKTGVQVAHNKGKHLVMIDGKRHYE